MKHIWFIAVIFGACLPVVGLAEDQVEVLRDPWGVPHVFASTEEAGFFGLGYATAEDRRLQMELVRRKGAGQTDGVYKPVLPKHVRTYRDAWNTMKAVSAKKMIALTECEGPPDPAKSFTDAVTNAPWLYSLSWYTNPANGVPANVLRQRVNNSYMINASDLPNFTPW